MTEIETALCEIGSKKRFQGHRRIEYAVQRVLEDDNRLLRIRDEIYCPVGEQVGCDWTAVEHSIRTVIKHIWREHPDRLRSISRFPLDGPPTSSDFIEMLAEHVRSKQAVHSERG